MLWQAISPLEAREMLLDLKVADFPHNDHSGKQKLHGATVSEAFPFAEKRSISWEEAAAMIGQKGTHG